jgi:photosystem II stability/assembly factor-like uncharacterized protein
VLSSSDGGQHWSSINGDNVHSDHHALWVNPDRSGHLILGNDGGINISKDNGATWSKCNSIPLGQFYSVNVDMAEPYNVYGGLQDNGVWKGPSTYEYSNAWLGEGKYPYEALMGGDGMKVQIDPRDNKTVYTGYQFGNYYRIDTETGKRQRITPLHELGERPYRWNWQSPILLSEHNPDIVYFGSNHFHRSMKKGEDFEDLSEDLTLGGKKGDVAFGTITTISESPLKFGLIYIGTDDGLIQVSNDVGDTWKKITDGLPTNYWVSRVEASHHREGRVYAALNGYRWDNFKALIYMSDDYGSTWKPIGLDLPAEPVNVIKEDPKNPNLLYVGTDHGLYASLDGGDHFMTLGNLPAVAIHDVVVHPRDNDLVVGTHGRSIYIGNVEHLQIMSNQILTEGNSIFKLSNPSYNDHWGNKWWTWGEYYEPELMIPFLAASAGEAKLEIKSGDILITSWLEKTDKGLNYLTYDLTIGIKQKENYQSSLSDQYKDAFKAAENGNWYLRPGKYTLIITNQGQTAKADFEIKAPKERPKRKS